MDENEEKIPASCLFISEDKSDSLYPMYFGVSCAFVALKLLSGSQLDDPQWSEMRNRMLQGSAHLLGLLVWRIQRGEATKRIFELIKKLEKEEMKVAELNRRRSEDAKANEKVVGIFAAQEQSWLSERKKLRQQIGALLNELQVIERKKEEIIVNLNGKLQEKELLIQSRDKNLEEEEGKRKEIEEKLQKAESVVEELRESTKKEAQLHSSEIWKHKTAFIELVSNQRHLEAEMGRAHRQVKAAKEELDSVCKQKEESVSMVQKLSMEVVKMHKDLEQKDKILSAMLRKSKLDTTEKQILLKEVKISKTRKKQAELETERWRTLCESKRERLSLRSNFSNQADSRSEVFSGFIGVQPIEAGGSQNPKTRLQPTDNRVNPKTRLLEYLEAEHRKERDCLAPQRSVNATSDRSDQYSPEGNKELVVTADVKQMEGWVHSEKESTNMLEQRHHLEIDAFAEQLRLKDEKLEAFRWRLLSMELESKRLQSHIEGLDQNISQLTEENIKLEALLLNREAELKFLKEKFISVQVNPSQCQNTNLKSLPKDLTIDQMPISSDVKIIKKDSRENEAEPKPNLIKIPREMETEKEEENQLEDQSNDVSLTVQAQGVIEVEKEVSMDTGDHVGKQCMGPAKVEGVDKLVSDGQCLIKKDTSMSKMDFHALGVSYNIKRLKQQLLLLDKLAGMEKSCEDKGNQDDGMDGMKSSVLLLPLLNKQVSRYHSLQEKIDDLCRRMRNNDLDGSGADSRIARTKGQTKTLENFLEETFQLQRYMVATGQKLTEIQSMIASGFVGDAEEINKSESFDMRRFVDSVRTLFKDVQKGLEVWIARIIGDLGGTLACESIIHLRNWSSSTGNPSMNVN